MSVRRLADDAVQPKSFAFTDENAAWADQTIRKYPEGRQQSAVIPLLMRAQEQDGWVTKAAIEYVADRLAMPLIRVLEVATFYTQFMLAPVGTRAHIQVCGTTPCMLRGAEDLKAVCKKHIHAEPFHRNESGTLSWEEVECQGACVNAPMVMIFKDAYEDLTPERLEEIIEAFEAGNGSSIKPGPQNGRHLSVPIGGLTSLTGDYDDLIEEQEQEFGHGPANGASDQGAGGGAASTPPSKAGRPDTHTPYTDKAIDGTGKAEDGNVPDTSEDMESEELVAEGHRPSAGQEGGAREGGTGEAERDAAETGHVTADDASAERAASGGDIIGKEAAARAAVIPSSHKLDDADGAVVGAERQGVDLVNRSGQLEGERAATDDVSAGAVHDDVFASKAQGDAEPGDPAHGPAGEGEKPQDLLGEPQGEKDDLQAIKGIGPVIEAKLNELGVYHFRQIAAWREKELVWVDNYLNFRGRAVRDRWTEQAKSLADGGQTPSGS